MPHLQYRQYEINVLITNLSENILKDKKRKLKKSIRIIR